MENEINNGGPAFPSPDTGDYYGMTLRDWFAGQVLSNPTVCDTGMHVKDTSHYAYAVADEMLSKRKEPT